MAADRNGFENDERKAAEKMLRKAYLELGKAYYEGAFEDPLPQLLPLFDKITKIKNELEGTKPEKPVRKNYCPKCGMLNEKNSLFCGYCGAKLMER